MIAAGPELVGSDAERSVGGMIAEGVGNEPGFVGGEALEEQVDVVDAFGEDEACGGA